MNFRFTVRSQALSVLLAGASLMACPAPTGAQESLDSLLQPYLAAYDLPAIGAAVMKDGELLAAGAVGTRMAGAQIPVTLEDRWHIGSLTKGVCATLAAAAVEQGALSWDTTVGAAFPELASRMDAGLATVTLRQLLSHSSGMPSDTPEIVDLYDLASTQLGNLEDLRYWLVQQWCTQPLVSPPGAEFHYSNLNFIFAGVMTERALGGNWEELVFKYIFEPLKLSAAGFGPQSRVGRVDAPLAHIVQDGKLKPQWAGSAPDNLLLIGPAGTAHMSVLDLARWADWNASEGTRPPFIVSRATARMLHRPMIAIEPAPSSPVAEATSIQYALGWVILEIEWAPHRLVHHVGDNGKNIAHAWCDPQTGLSFVIVSNVDSPAAQEALYVVAEQLYGRFGGK